MEEPNDKTVNQENLDKPATNPALMGILGSALKSSLKYDSASAGLETKKCPNCGAARPADTDLKQCAFCEYHFY